MGHRIGIPLRGAEGDAYAATPGDGRGAGVLLLHAWWGLNPFFLDLADRFAGEGFVALAPDYMNRATAGTIEEARKLRAGLDRKAANKLVKGAAGSLLNLPEVAGDRIGVVAFSLGCSFGIEIARTRPKAVGGVVLFYGTGGGKFEPIRAPFLGHFAEDDRWGADAGKVASLEKRLRGANLPYEFHTYPGTRHWFFEKDRAEAFNPAAAEEAWTRTVTFLRARLG